MEEIKEFFIRNGAKKHYGRYYLPLKDDYEILLDGKYVFIIDMKYSDGEVRLIGKISIYRIKALIYGLTGKNLD